MLNKQIILCGLISLILALENNNISSGESDETGLECHGNRTFKNVSLTAFYPSLDSEEDEEDYDDAKGDKLRTLQDFLDDSVQFVTVSMDAKLRIPYGKVICIPELNHHFQRRIRFEVRDHGYNVKGMGYKQVDICVRSEADSYDRIVNLERVTVVM